MILSGALQQHCNVCIAPQCVLIISTLMLTYYETTSRSFGLQI